MSVKSSNEKSLAIIKPNIAKEWHPTKNGDLTPHNVSSGSAKKVWWKCSKGDDHEWLATINNRTKPINQNCPICSGQKVVLSNCLATLRTDIANEWHPTKNNPLTPFDVTCGASKRVWWKCKKGDDHEWQNSISNRTTQNQGCPICQNKKVVLSNCLATVNPTLSKEWHPTKNLPLTPYDIVEGSNKKIWWKCDKGEDHEWKTALSHRINGRNCPICSGRKVVLSNSLFTLNSELAKEWHPLKNESISIDSLTLNSHKKIWWKCDKGEDHEWEASVASRNNGRGCPICSGKKVVKSNSLATLNKEISRQWHPVLNGNLTPNDVTIKTGLKVWWKCSKGDDHIWNTSIDNRSNGRGCPFCTLTPQSRQELMITFELKQFFDINPRGFKTRVNGKLLSIDIYISDINLGIEFDGSYWHKDKRALDKLKTEHLLTEGFKIMRIREEPLKPITPIDVVSKIPFNAKIVTNAILEHILSNFEMNHNKVSAIKDYFRKKTVQNEASLNEYIDLVLYEKSKNKKKNTK